MKYYGSMTTDPIFGQVREGKTFRTKDGKQITVTFARLDANNRPVVVYHHDSQPHARYLGEFLNEVELCNAFNVDTRPQATG